LGFPATLNTYCFWTIIF